MLKVNQKLVQYYTDMLNKVTAQYAGDARKLPYIKQARKNLKAVKNGRQW